MSAKTPFRPGSGQAWMPPEPPRVLRPMLIRLAVLLAILAAGHTALWRWSVGRLEEGFSAWAAARGAEGWQVTHGPPQPGGWPLAAALRLPELRLTDPGGDAWQAAAVVLRLEPPVFDRLQAEALGPQRLRLGGEEIPVTAEAMRAVLPVRAPPAGALPPEAALRAARLRLDMPAGPLEVAGLRVEVAQPLGAPPNAATATLQAAAEVVTLPPLPGRDAAALLAERFGRRLEGLRLELALTGPMPPPFGTPTARAVRWRDAGGAMEVRALSLRWGPAAATARATLALDEALQPAGAGTLRLVGADALLNAATELGLLPQRNAGAVRLFLGTMQRRPSDGGPPVLEVPLTLEERTLTFARFPLARLPALAW